ncbi:MAG: cytochrome c biogenesis protein ResB [Nocardioides sp.]|uniref:cytochrome c biogenesis protein ResB n=1 Tax=Nocardioides sp. TaxID=35761 RepID=UPI0039E447C1
MSSTKPREQKRSPRRTVRDRTSRVSELTIVEFARWLWRQLTSMRTALLLLLLLALAAVPGSLIPQSGIDSLKVTNWKAAHQTLTPIYDKLGLFDVYGTPWFAAIYILLMVSLVGCIVPRLFVYWRGFRAQPPTTPYRLSRMPDSTSYLTEESPEEVLAGARRVLRRKRYRLRRDDTAGVEDTDGPDSVSAEKGYLREAGNLVFHLSILIVLVGFAMGSLFGYKGGVIVYVGDQYGFSNQITQYDDLDPGSLFSTDDLDKFSFSIDSFDVDWVTSGEKAGLSRGFQSHLSYTTGEGAAKKYDLRVNHPLTIDGTQLFLIGFGYAPVITVRDGEGNVVTTGPQVFLPEDSSMLSFGVVKNQYAKPEGLGIQALFYPYEWTGTNGDPINLQGDIGDGSHAMLSMTVWKGNLNLTGSEQSIYQLDTSKATKVTAKGGKAFNLKLGQTVKLPNGLGSISFDGIKKFNKIQISKQPGRHIALAGVSLALLGLIGSLFIRPRRVWVRARRTKDGTLVEVAVLDRSGGGDPTAVLDSLTAALRGTSTQEPS